MFNTLPMEKQLLQVVKMVKFVYYIISDQSRFRVNAKSSLITKVQ